MKKSLLLTTAAMCAFGMMAQTDVTPANWDFNKMQPGPAEGVFIKELASKSGNLEGSDLTGRANLAGEKGGIVLTSWYGTAGSPETQFTDEDKARYEEYYTAAQIVDGGDENLLCLVGPAATATFPGGVKAPSLPATTLVWMTADNLTSDNYYRITFDYRAITDNTDNSQKIQWQTGDIGWNGIDKDVTKLGNKISVGNRTIENPCFSGMNNNWYRMSYDIYYVKNSDEQYLDAPLLIKMNYGPVADNSILLFRSVKLERIDNYADDHIPSYTNLLDFEDIQLASVEAIDYENDVIVTTNGGNITVIDANAPVEVYNIAGVKVASVAAPAAVETISLDMNGVFVVKVGDKAQKVVL